MRILYLNHNLRGRGTWFRCYHFARHLVRRGHEVTIWTCSPGVSLRAAESTLDGVRVIETPRLRDDGKHDGGWGMADLLWRLRKSLRGGYDLVHAFDHRPSVSLPGALLGLRTETRLAADWADWWGRGGILAGRRPFAWMERAEAWWEERQKRSADAVTCISRVLMERAAGLGIPGDRLLWIPSGADTAVFRPLPQAECRRALGLPEEAVVVGFAGFQLWDLQLLVEAFGRTAQEIPRARLLLIGPADSASIPETLRGRVHCTGPLAYDAMPGALNCADVLALPLRDNNANRGRFPGKLAEYLACGRPVVTQDVGDTGAVIRESGGGVITAGDAGAFAAGIAELLCSDARRAALGAAARDYAASRLEWGLLTETLLDFYERIRT